MADAPGWYPDPNDAGSEIYWDGAKWHRLQNRPPPVMLSDWPTPEDSGVLDGCRRFWGAQTKPVRLIIITDAVLIVISMVIGLAAIVDARPWESQRYKDCKAAGEYQGYQGDELTVFIDFCAGMEVH